jgi:O-antigen biosynthesis protein
MAMMELGFKTCHTCFDESTFGRADAFFDTPVYATYPLLDERYSGARYILTWRDPDAWYASFSKTLLAYLSQLRNTDKVGAPRLSALDRVCYTHVFGTLDIIAKDFLISRYRQHRREAEEYFITRPGQLLVLDMDTVSDAWDYLCPFLSRVRPSEAFPRVNGDKTIDTWQRISHPNKVT